MRTTTYTYTYYASCLILKPIILPCECWLLMELHYHITYYHTYKYTQGIRCTTTHTTYITHTTHDIDGYQEYLSVVNIHGKGSFGRLEFGEVIQRVQNTERKDGNEIIWSIYMTCIDYIHDVF